MEINTFKKGFLKIALQTVKLSSNENVKCISLYISDSVNYK